MSYSSEVLADSPAVYFRMQEASGLIQDSSGNARHATASSSSGTATYQQASPIATDPSDYSILFNLMWFRVPDQAGFDLGDVFTLEAWVKRTTSGTEEFVFGKGLNAYGLEIGRVLDDKTLVHKYGVQDLANGDPIKDTGWHHIVATKSGATTKVYHDGVDRTAFILDATCTDTILDLWIGASGDGLAKSTSYLDELAVYPTALSATRVRVHYDAAFIVPDLPVIQSRVPMPMFAVPGRDTIRSLIG